jgi:hypothetical protein
MNGAARNSLSSRRDAGAYRSNVAVRMVGRYGRNDGRWSWLWVAAMLGYATTVARRRAPEVPAS